jgi:indole-3-glycerol phosphate synthase
MSLLEEIVAHKRASLAELSRKLELRMSSDPQISRPLDLVRRGEDGLLLCAEHKRRSPSGGLFDSTLSLEERVVRYARTGARLVSVLTDAPYFGGSYEDLARARKALDTDARVASSVRLLAKEFVIDALQVRAARAFGADAVLLIVRLLDEAALKALMAEASAQNLTALVEVTSEDELRRALASGAEVVGVNARDLDTLEMNPERAARVIAAIPRAVAAVHLSGIRTPAEVAALAEGRADAALIGETLMREADPGPMLDAMVEAAKIPRIPRFR